MGELAFGLLLANAAFSPNARAQLPDSQPQSPSGNATTTITSEKFRLPSLSELASVRASAQDGDPHAQYKLAEWLSTGVIKSDPKEAFRLYERSAGLNYPPAQFALGMLWKRGHQGGQSDETALKLITASAKQGHAQAQLFLGDALFAGLHGLAIDRKVSYSWYKLAAERGLPEAQYMVGNFHLAGYGGVEPDRKLGIKWFTKAAEQGEIIAIHNLGKVLIESDPKQALAWLKKAAEKNFTASQLLAGELLLSGDLPNSKPSEAIELFKKAADNGSPVGALALGKALLQVEGAPRAEQAIEHLKAAAEKGLPDACRWLAMLLYNGAHGVPVDKKEAFSWGEKAAKLGSQGAQFQVGMCLHNGDGVTQDRAAAKTWFETGARAGDLNCKFMLAFTQLEDSQNKHLPWQRANLESRRAALKSVMPELIECAKANMVPAQSMLGKLLAFGGPEVDAKPEEGAGWLRKAAEAGSMNNAYYLGHYLMSTKKYDDALPWLKKAADNKLPHAYGPLGFCLMNATAEHADPKEGFALLLKAAELGFGEAQSDVAFLYEKGSPGIPRNAPNALKWHLRAAKQGSAPSARAIADMYEGRRGIAQNLQEYFKWHLIVTRHETNGFKHEEGVISSTEIIKTSFKEPLDNVRSKALEDARLFKLVREELPPIPEEKMEFLEEKPTPFDLTFSLFTLESDSKDRRLLVSAYRRDAELGSNFDKFTIGMAFLEGVLVDRNVELGTALLKEAAQGKVPKAQYEYGKLLLTQEKPDSVEGVHWLEQAAAQGHADAQLDLGRRLIVTGNKTAALRWLNEASSAGNLDGKIELATLLQSIGTTEPPINWKRITALLEEAAEQSHGAAQYKLAWMILDGAHPTKKARDAISLLEQSAARGEANAQAFLGSIIATGQHGVNKDQNRALELLSSAARSGTPVAFFTIGELLLEEDYAKRDPVLAFQNFQEAAKRGVIQAHYKLGSMCKDGIGTPKNFSEAIRHFDTIARAGSVDAQIVLARLYAADAGKDYVDYVLAYAWATVAAANGDKHAQVLLDWLPGVMEKGQTKRAAAVAQGLWSNPQIRSRLK